MSGSNRSENIYLSYLADYPHVASYIAESPAAAPAQIPRSGLFPGNDNNRPAMDAVRTNIPLSLHNIIYDQVKLEQLEQILSDKEVYAVALKMRHQYVLDELLDIKKAGLIYRLKFCHQVADLNLWMFDLGSLANYLEALITNIDPWKTNIAVVDENYTRYFDYHVAKRVVASKDVGTEIFSIEVTDPDIVKYIKSFINFTRAVKKLDPGIKNSYISHLLAKPGFTHLTDGNLQDVVSSAYKNPDQFEQLYEHFTAFTFYAGEYGELLSNLPLLQGEAKKVFSSLRVVYGTMSLKTGNDYLKSAKEKRDDKKQGLVNRTVIPVIKKRHYSKLLDQFGVRTYLDALTGIARTMNLDSDEQYYLKLSDKYSYPPSVTAESKQLMDAYNVCSGARSALQKASEAFDAINSFRKKLPVTACWSALTEDQRQLYIDFNNAMIKAEIYLSTMQPLVSQYPKLRHIMKRSDANIQRQIQILAGWKGSTAEKAITKLEDALSPNKVLVWLSKQAKKQLTQEDRDIYFDAAQDLFLGFGSVDEKKMNVMLGYNIIVRIKHVYEVLEKLSSEKFSLSHISAAIQLLYQIGEMVKEYESLRGASFIESLRQSVQEDISIIMSALIPMYHKAIYRCAKLEERQGLRKGLLMQYLVKFQEAYTYLEEKSKSLPDLYKLDIHSVDMDDGIVEMLQEAALAKIKKRGSRLACQAHQAKDCLEGVGVDLFSKPYNIVSLLQVKEIIQALPGHHASQYVNLLQVLINKLVGLDVLENEIIETENAIRAVTGDNVTIAALLENDQRIQDNLNLLRDLYKNRACLKDMVNDLDKCKLDDDRLAGIPLSHFYKKAAATRGANWLMSNVSSAYNTTTYSLEPGMNASIELGKIPEDIEKLRLILLAESAALIGTTTYLEVSKNVRSVVDNDDFSPSTENQVMVDALVSDVPKMIGHLIHARQGKLVLQVEQWRQMFVNKAKMTVIPNYRDSLTNGADKMGIYQIGDSEPIMVVNIKATSNVIVRTEQLLTTISKLSEIPTKVRVYNFLAQARILSLLTELNESLNSLFVDLEIMTESMRALIDCIRNETFDAFLGDIGGHIVKVFDLIRGVISYSYVGVDNQNYVKFEKMTEWVVKLITDATKAPKALQDPDHTRQLDNVKKNVHTNITKNLVLYLKHEGEVHREPGGRYDVKGLQDGSMKMRIATMLNHHIDAGIMVPEANDIAISDNADYRSVVLKVMKTLGLFVRNLRTAETVIADERAFQGQHNAEDEADEGAPLLAGDQPEMVPVDVDLQSRVILYLRLYLESANAVRNADGDYDLQNFEDGSLYKLVATFLNIKGNLSRFLDATVSMTDGHNVMGLISSVIELLKIKRKLDRSNMLHTLKDYMQHANFDFDIVKSTLDDLLQQAFNSIEPKIINAVVKARVAEVATGIRENGLLSTLRKGVTLFVKARRYFVGDDYDYLLNEFPYNNKTCEVADRELVRLNGLHEQAELEKASGTGSVHLFIHRAVNDLGVFTKALKKSELAKVQQPKKSKQDQPQLKQAPVPIPVNDLEPVIMSEAEDANDENVQESLPLLQDDDIGQGVAVPALEEHPLKANVSRLDAACWAYKVHLVNNIVALRKKTEPDDEISYDNLRDFIPEVENASDPLSLAIRKYNAVHLMHMELLSEAPAAVKLQSFRVKYTDSAGLLNTRRDTAFVTFAKVVLTALLLFIPIPMGLWKPKGMQLGKTINEELAPLPRAMPGG